MPLDSTIRLIALPEVMQMTGLRRTSVYELVKTGGLPAPRKVSERSIRWVESEVAEWCASRPAITVRSPAAA
jgi:prophage regulatory protein